MGYLNEKLDAGKLIFNYILPGSTNVMLQNKPDQKFSDVIFQLKLCFLKSSKLYFLKQDDTCLPQQLKQLCSALKNLKRLL